MSLAPCPVARWGIDSKIITRRIDEFMQDGNALTATSSRHTSLPLRLVQVNPCTLRSKDKLDSFLKQFSCGKTHIFFAQEHRRKHTCVVSDGGYTLAFCGAESGGHGGCLVGVADHLDFVGSQLDPLSPVKVINVDVNIIHVEQRIVVTRVSSPCFQAVCVSIHELDRSHGEQAVASFWKKAGDDLLKCCRPDDTVICGVDANCRIGRNLGTDDAIAGGLLDAERRHSFVSDAFVRFARRLGLKIRALSSI